MPETPDGWVAWSRGLLVRRQHLQHVQRYAARLIADARDAGEPFPYGWIEPPDTVVQNGRLIARNLRGVLPDGTAIHADEAAGPLPVASRGMTAAVQRDDAWQRARVSIPAEDDPTAAVEVDLLRPRLSVAFFQAGEVHPPDALPVARFSADGALDPAYVPPCRYVGAAPAVVERTLRPLVQAVRTAAAAVASRLRGDGFRIEMAAPDQTTLVLRAVAVGRHASRLEALLAADRVGPFAWFLELAALRDDLGALYPDASLEPLRYDHAIAASVLAGVADDCRRLLKFAVEGRFQAVSFQRAGDRYTTRLRADLLTDRAQYFLGLEASAAGEVAAYVCGPRFRLFPLKWLDAVVGVSGVQLEAAAPAELPSRPGLYVFRLTAKGPMWEQAVAGMGLEFRWTAADPPERVWLFVVLG